MVLLALQQDDDLMIPGQQPQSCPACMMFVLLTTFKMPCPSRCIIAIQAENAMSLRTQPCKELPNMT